MLQSSARPLHFLNGWGRNQIITTQVLNKIYAVGTHYNCIDWAIQMKTPGIRYV